MERSEQLIESFLEHKATNEGGSAGTTRKYRQYLTALFTYLRETHGCDPLRPSADALLAYTGPYLHKKGLIARSRKPVISAIKGFYAWLQRRGVVSDNAAAQLESPKAGRSLPRAMGLDAAEKLMFAPDLDTFMGVRDAAMLGVLIGCGIRVEGLVELNASRLQWATFEGQETLAIMVLEKGNKERLVPAPAPTRLLLRAYLGHQDLDSIDRTLPDGDKVLFVSTRNRTVPPHEYHGENRRLSDWSVRDMIKRYCDKVGVAVDVAHPHALRHLYGTELAESEVSEPMRQMLMGHVDPASTAIYTHLATRKQRATIEKANPLAKIRTPVSELVKRLSR